MSYRLYVRDFAPQTDVSDMEIMFSSVGTVSSAILSETEYKGAPRQVAYIEMSSDEEMQDCITRFHGMKSDGYVMTVTEDKVHVPNPNYVGKSKVKMQSPKPKTKRPRKSRVHSTHL